MLDEIIRSLRLPPLGSREEMLRILQENEYGFQPPKPDSVTWEVKTASHKMNVFCFGRGIRKEVLLTSTINGKSFTFPLTLSLPVTEGKHPFFVCISPWAEVPNRFLPIEEIIDQGYAVISFCFTDVTSDNGDFTNGLAGILDQDRGDTAPGKIAMWAWAASRAMDFVQSMGDVLDLDRSCVCGHSRLGKTAVLAGALDPRFRFVYSCQSGCSGVDLGRKPNRQSVTAISQEFPFWFCKNYGKYGGHEETMPFDQHYMLASIAPRYVCIANDADDLWADPLSALLSARAASPAFEVLGCKGLMCYDRMPEIGDEFFEGHIGYHMRSGEHFFGRNEWNSMIRFMERHRDRETD